LLASRRNGEIVFKVVDHKGPIALYAGDNLKADIEMIKGITIRYSDAPKESVEKVWMFEGSSLDNGVTLKGSAKYLEENPAEKFML